MNKKVFFLLLSLLVSLTSVCAEEVQKSSLQQRAEAEDAKHNVAAARSLFIHAFNDYANRGQVRQGVECAARATALYYKENYYKEAFDLLRRADQTVIGSSLSAAEKSASHYLTTKERMQMYIKLRKPASALDQLKLMETQASQSGDERVQNDLLYNKAIYHYTFGQNAQGNAVFQEMVSKLTASKEYDKVDEVYRTLIANGRRSNNANIVAQSYSNYLAWKDSASAMKLADETGALKKQIAANEASIADKDSSLKVRTAVIWGLVVLAVALAAALVVGGLVLLRYILLTRKQQKTIKQANENNALKAKFISNISAQLEPTFRKLDSRVPEVQALLNFSQHVQTLSELENSLGSDVEKEDTQVPQFCEKLLDQVRPTAAKRGITLTLNAPNMSAKLNRDYVTHILLHLLGNAIQYTPEGGNVTLDFKKRRPHTFHFLVSDTGQGIPEEKRDDVFKPFVEVRDLTQGDGLGLPICKQMALKMNGDLDLDNQYTKGTRFVLELNE